jgi:hypothetical protein
VLKHRRVPLVYALFCLGFLALFRLIPLPQYFVALYSFSFVISVSVHNRQRIPEMILVDGDGITLS